ncbi:MAG: universal stress protein [Azospirillum sp.]|nr:universal stress protein [Azospirillum sp.]
MVHLDESPRSAVRLKLAVTLADKYGAHLVGLFAQLGEPHAVGMIVTWPSSEYEVAANQSRQLFEQAAANLTHAEWRDANRGSESEVTRIATETARHFDLVILGQTDHARRSPVPADLVEKILLTSGRPALIVPYAGQVAALGQRPLFAWNQGREAVRAANDALALIPRGAQAVIVSLAGDDLDMRHSAEALSRHLGCHGIKSGIDCLTVTDVGRMDMLLSLAADAGADLLVMGAYGNYGFPNFARGSGTRFILEHMTLPVLMSH